MSPYGIIRGMSKPIAIQIQTPRLLLSPAHQSFAPAITHFFQSQKKFLAPWSPIMQPAFFTLDFQRKKIGEEQTQLRKKKALRFWIFAHDDTQYQQVLGQLHFSNIVWGGFCSCFLGYSMAQEYNGRGLMTEALEAAIAFLFEHWQIHRIEANIMPRNLPSIAVAKKCGFYFEGHAPRYLKINGQWEDHDHYVRRNLSME